MYNAPMGGADTPASPAAPAPAASPLPSGAPALWRQNTDLRQRNAELEAEVASLQQTATLRRLTQGSSAAASRRASQAAVGEGEFGSGEAASLAGGSLNSTGQSTTTATGVAVAARVAELETALAEARHAGAATAAGLAAARAEAAVAGAGIQRLGQQLSGERAAAEQLRSRLDEAEAEGQRLEAAMAARADLQQAEAAAARAAVLDLQGQLEALKGQQERVAEQRQSLMKRKASNPSPLSRSSLPTPPRSASPTQDAAAPASSPPPTLLSCGGTEQSQGAHIVVTLPALPAADPASGEPLVSAVAAASVLAQQERELAGLRERLRGAEAELAAQLAEKQAAQLELAVRSAEAAALRSERELLQEQAVSLQQEVSDMQSEMHSAGGSPLLSVERSPSRTLASRMKEMLGPRRSPPQHPQRAASPGSPGADGRGSAGASPAATPRAGSPGPLGEGLTLRSLQGHVMALEHRLASKEMQLAEQAAGAAATLAAARSDYEVLAGRAAAAEAAAEAVLRVHAEGEEGLAAVGGAEGNHQHCLATMQGLYAQMWRERLGRQKAQAQAEELQQRLSGQQDRSFAAGGGGGAPGTASSGVGGLEEEVDEALMRSLEGEMARGDHLQEELRRYKAHQAQLQRRADQLELQLASYNTLLTAAEGVTTVPGLACMAAAATRSPPRSPRRSAAAGSASAGSPVQAALTALAARKVAEEAAALREQLKAAQADVASMRRRERDSLASLKAARDARREQERKQQMLAAGLETLRRLLARRSHLGSTTGSMNNTAGSMAGGGGSPRSPGRQRAHRDASQLGETALGVLSALLKALQAEGGGEGTEVVSPQASELLGAEVPAAGETAAEAVPLELAQSQGENNCGEEGEEGQSDTLDVAALLPEGGDSFAALGATLDTTGGAGGDSSSWSPGAALGLDAAAAAATAIERSAASGSTSTVATAAAVDVGGAVTGVGRASSAPPSPLKSGLTGLAPPALSPRWVGGSPLAQALAAVPRAATPPTHATPLYAGLLAADGSQGKQAVQGEAGAIRAVHRAGTPSTVALRANASTAGSATRIPGPPSKGAWSAPSSPGSSGSKLARLLLAPCRRPGPHATLSSDS